MRLRTVLRLGMVGLAATVMLVVYLQYRPGDPGATNPAATREMSVPDAEPGRPVSSYTQSLNVTKTANGRPVFSIAAALHLDYVDGWNEWTDPVLTIHGRTADGDVSVVSERMRTGGEIDEPTEVRMIGAVRASLPGGGSFEARRLDFDAVTGVVSGCNHNTLRYAGMEVRSDCLHFQTAGDVTAGDDVVPEVLRMWEDLSLRSAEEESGLPPGLKGEAEELRFRPGGEIVTLTGGPRLEFSNTSVRGDELVLDIGLDANELRRVEAYGGARLRFEPSQSDTAASETEDEAAAALVDSEPAPPAPESVADIDSGPATPTTGGHILRGDRLLVEFGEGAAISSVRAFSETSEAARLLLDEFGRLFADEIELVPGDAGQTVIARGTVQWEGSVDTIGVRRLSSTVLTLELMDGALRKLEASRDVVAELVTTEGEAPRSFRGERLVLELDAGKVALGSWPRGVVFNTDGKEVTAARAALTPTTGNWVLSGRPRPTVTDVGLRLESDSMELDKEGKLRAIGQVLVDLGGDNLAAAGALFGSVPTVGIRNGLTEIDAGGKITMRNRVQVVWESQSLVADQLRLETDPGRLYASGSVELVAATGVDAAPVLDPASAPDDADRSSSVAQFITVTARNLLVEEETAEIRVAGEAMLRQGERKIKADKITVEVDATGGWSSVLAEDAVDFRDELGTATSESLRYDLVSGEILLQGSKERPAAFVYQGIEYRSNDALRVRFEDDQVAIEATEDGRTITKTVPVQIQG